MSSLSSSFADDRLCDLVEEYGGDIEVAAVALEMESDWLNYIPLVEFDSDGTMWTMIPGFSKYYVSDSGFIASALKGQRRILKTWTNQYGHHYTAIVGDDGIKVKVLVHRMVAMVYVPNPCPEDYKVVRHLDDDPDNNDASNLRWGTPAMNHQDMVDHDREFTKKVYCYEQDRVFRSCKEAADEFGTTVSAISSACNGSILSVKGFHLCFLEDKEKRLADLDNWIDMSRTRGTRKVKAINLNSGDTYIFDSRQQASRALGIADSGISNVISGRIKSAKGWTFVDMS